MRSNKTDFVQLPLPGLARPRWYVRAYRSTWFDVAVALVAVWVALALLGGCATAPPCEERTTASGMVIPAEVACIIDRPGGAL